MGIIDANPRCKRSRAVRFLQRTAAGADKELRTKRKHVGIYAFGKGP